MKSNQQKSINNLISELCTNIHKTRGAAGDHENIEGPQQNTHFVDPRCVKRSKSSAFEILLNKSARQTSEGCADFMKELYFLKFQLIYDAANSYSHRARIQELDRCIESVADDPVFENDAGQNVLLFLANLANSDEGVESVYNKWDEFLFGNNYFQQNHMAKEYQPYQLILPDARKLGRTDCLVPLGSTNPYFTKLNAQNVFTKLIEDARNGSNNCGNKYFTVCHDELMPFSKCTTNFMSLLGADRRQKSIPSTKLDNRRSLKATKSQPSLKCKNPITTISIRTNWEHLGQYDIVPELAFATEHPESLPHLLAIHKKFQLQRLAANVVCESQFIQDIKSVLVGIQSDSFHLDTDAICFHMEPNLTIRNVAPATISAIVAEFLECGACYKRLQLMIATNPMTFALRYDGFVYKALCTSIEKYLLTFRQFVLRFDDRSVLSLSVRMTDMIQQIRMLSKILVIHPNEINLREIPRGSEFLGYLYREIIAVTQRDVIMLFVFILQQCCYVYFRNFEKWIFHGYIDDPCKELFVEFVNHYRSNTKYFWDKAYLVKRQCVPAFLQGYEDVTLLCGKYTMLLKAFKPSHPLLSIDPPEIQVCLSFSQIKAMQEKCRDYLAKAQRVCGERISVTDIFVQKAAKRRHFVALVAKKFQENLEKWKAEQLAKVIEQRELKEKDRVILEQQIAEVREKKIQKRLENLQLEREYLRQEQLIEDERVVRENVQRQKNIDYYTELGALVDAQRERAEELVKRVRGEEKSPDIVGEEILQESFSSPEYLPADGTQESDENDEVYHSLESNNDLEIVATEDKIADDELNRNYEPLKKSQSDFFNANEIQSDLQSNKTKMLATTHDFTAQLHVLTSSETCPNLSTTQLTDAQRNKIKILTQTSYDNCDNKDPKQRDGNSNEVLSDRQKNKQKVMQQEYGFDVAPSMPEIVVAADTEFQRNQQQGAAHTHQFGVVPPQTDLEKNRQRVLQDEYGLTAFQHNQQKAESHTHRFNDQVVVRDKRNLSLDLKATDDAKRLSLYTPMSTDSDLTPCRDSLKLDTTLPLPDLPKYCGLFQEDGAVNHLTVKTPESALNTAGILAKSGFDFPTPLKTEKLVVGPTSKSEFFRLNLRKPTLDSTPEELSGTNQNLEELQNLNITTITHFLKMSFVCPMQAHLTILNNEILKIYLQDFDILGHFKSLRNYFLMMDGEFASYICDGLISKLEDARAQPAELLNFHILHSLLDSALSSSIIGNDKNAGNLSFCVEEIPERFDLTSPNVLRVLNLSYAVEWPLNLLLNPETIAHYAKIFQHLIKLRRISWVLERTFQILKETSKKSGHQILRSPQYRHAQQIRNKLLTFINALQTHITSNALQASWRRFKMDLETVKSMEDLYQKHTKYLKRVEFLCMLNKSSYEFYIKLEDIFVIVLRFYHKLAARNWRQTTADSGATEFIHPNFQKFLIIEKDFQKLIKFVIHAGAKMSRRGYQTEIGEFINMININGYYDV